MPYLLNCQPDERILADIDFQPSAKSNAFRFAVTNQAVFVPAVKFVVAGDARYFKRVSFDQIEEVHVQPIKPYAAYGFAVIMALVGCFALYSFTLQDAHLSPRGLGYAGAFVVGGLLLPLTAKGRHRLVVRMKNTKFVWNPPMVVDKGSKQQVNAVLDAIVHAAAEVQLPVNDERQKAAQPAASAV